MLQVVNVKNKDIPYQYISVSHPEIQEQEKSIEAKKYTYRSLNRQGDEEGFTLDEQVDGSTEDFDLVGVQPTFRKFCTLSKIRHEKSQKPVR